MIDADVNAWSTIRTVMHVSMCVTRFPRTALSTVDRKACCSSVVVNKSSGCY